jgi:serine/threonine protein kinase/WD40 repeat protein/tetratricopeptide (TPR) repeat protein
MPADSSAIDPIDPVGPLADDFLARHRRGEQPAVDDYAARYPELAERIRHLFPMLVAMEAAGADASAGATLPPIVPGEALGPRLEHLGGYRILREIGRGGMGVVYEAEQVALGRHVALKVLPLHAARDGSGLDRFRLEARAAARLHHTNIVPVYEVGQDGDAYFYAMQFITGQPLDQVLDELRKLRAPGSAAGARRSADPSAARTLLAGVPAPAPLSAPDAAPPSIGTRRGTYYASVARVGVQVAQALDYAHKEGIIHRDVKPSNLLLDGDGRVWVTDFGLAKTDGTALTRTGDIVGTVRYMAPERFNGWSDPRSDVYSLGVTLYEMLALRPAFGASEHMRLMQQVVHEEPTALRKLDVHVPRDLETVIARSIDKEPSRRYQTAGEFAADLQRFLEDRPVLARRASLGERGWRWSKRNPALAAATALTFAALLIATVVSVMFAVAQHRAADEQKRLGEERQAALDKSQHLAADLDLALKETRGHAARSAVDRAQGLMEQGRLHEAMLWLARAVEQAPEGSDVRRYARASFASLEADAPALQTMWLPHHPGAVVAAALSSDGTRILTGSEVSDEGPAEARLWDAVTGQPLTEPLPHRGSVTQVAISPDSKVLLTVSSPQPSQWEVRLWDAATGEPLTDPIPHPGPVTAVICGAAGKRFVTVGSPKPEEPAQARLWRVAGTTAGARVLDHPGAVTALALSADGKDFITTCQDLAGAALLQVWELAGEGNSATVLQQVDNTRVTAAAGAAGDLVYLGTDAGTVLLWDPGRKRVTQWPYGARGPVRGLTLSPAGDLALVTTDNVQTGRLEARLWDRFRGQPVGVALSHEAASVRAAFAADGRHLLTWDQKRPVRVWDLGPERRWLAAVPVPLPPAGTGPRSIQFDPDGRTLTSLAMAFQVGASVRRWDADTGLARGAPTDASARAIAAVVCPDGRTTLVAGSHEVRFWDNTTGKPLGPRQPCEEIQALAFSPDGKTVALANLQRLWLKDVATGEVIGPNFPAPGPLNNLCFSADGKSLWLTTSTSVRCLDVASGHDAAPGLAVRGRGFHQVVPSPAGDLLAVIDQTGVAVWDTRTGRRTDLFVPEWASHPARVAFTPDGRGLLVVEATGMGAQLWDIALAKPIGQPVRWSSIIQGVAVRPDGRALALLGRTGVVGLARLPEPAAGDAEKVRLRAQALCGLELSPAGDVRGLDPAAWQTCVRAAPAPEPQPAQDWHMHRALDRGELEDWTSALWYLDQHLRERPDDWLALTLRARALANLNRSAEAAAALDRSFEKGPADTVFAWQLLAAQRPQVLIDYGVEAVRAKPRLSAAPPWFLDRLIARNARESAPLLQQRGRNRAAAKQWDRAIEDYEHAGGLAPDNATLQVELGRLYAQQKKPDKAAECFVRAAAAQPDDSALWTETARELVRLERWPLAAEHYLHALDLLPDGNHASAPRAELSLELARAPKAFDEAVKKRPNDRYLWSGRARYHVERKEWQAAANDFARAVALGATEEPSFEYAAVLLLLDDEAGYRKHVGHMLERDGGSPEPVVGYVLARTCGLVPHSPADPARVVAWAERAVANRPGAGWYLHVLGLALYRKGELREAVARLEEAERTGWAGALNWLVLAMAEQRLGRPGAARRHLGMAMNALDTPETVKGFYSTDVLEAQVLRREAEEMVLGKKNR